MKILLSFFSFVDRAFARTIETVLIAVLLAMVGVIASQVLLRVILSSGIQWADIAARQMVMWVAFLGAMLATRLRQHIAIDVITRFIPRRPRNVMRIVLDALACAVTLLLARAAFLFVLEERAMGTELVSGFPTWYVQTIIPFGFAMISLEYAIGIGLDIYRIVTPGHGKHEAGKGRL